MLSRAWNKSSAGIFTTHLAPNPPGLEVVKISDTHLVEVIATFHLSFSNHVSCHRAIGPASNFLCFLPCCNRSTAISPPKTAIRVRQLFSAATPHKIHRRLCRVDDDLDFVLSTRTWWHCPRFRRHHLGLAAFIWHFIHAIVLRWSVRRISGFLVSINYRRFRLRYLCRRLCRSLCRYLCRSLLELG